MKIILLLLSLSLVASGSTLSNRWSVGNGTGTGNKEIIANKGSGATNPRIRYDVGSSSWKFSNDGSSYSEVAAGGVDSSDLIRNMALGSSVGSSALTISLFSKAGTAPSATDVVQVAFRNTTAATGDYSVVSVSAATTLVISSGSTLGLVSGSLDQHVYVYAVNNSGTLILAASKKLFPDNSIQSTTAEGGAGAADSGTVLYSASAVSSKAVRLLGRMNFTLATAGTWGEVADKIQLEPLDNPEVFAIVTGDPANATSGNPIIFGTAGLDNTGAYNTSTGEFTVPASGVYSVTGYFNSGSSAVPIDAYVGGVQTRRCAVSTSTNNVSLNCRVLLYTSQVLTIRPVGFAFDTGSDSWLEFRKVGNSF